MKNTISQIDVIEREYDLIRRLVESGDLPAQAIRDWVDCDDLYVDPRKHVKQITIRAINIQGLLTQIAAMLTDSDSPKVKKLVVKAASSLGGKL